MFDKITKNGYKISDLVELVDLMTGEKWLPMDIFAEIGNAVLGATDSSTTVGLKFDKDTDEHFSINLKPPKDLDVTAAVTFKIYWSSANTTASKVAAFGLSAKASADGEDIGGTHTLSTVVLDTDDVDQDGLNITDALSVAANFMASTDELLSLSFYRDADHASDNVAVDVVIYGVLMEYKTNPEIDKDRN